MYPNASLLQNIGFDNSGTHCSDEDFFSNINVSNSGVVVEKKTVKLDNKIVKLFKKSFENKYNNNFGLVKKIKLIIEKGIAFFLKIVAFARDK